MLAYGTDAVEQGDRFRGAYVSIRETVGRPVGGPEGSFEPPAGAVFLRGGSAYLVRDGIHIRITAASEELALTAARRLRPYP
jgi:hypothetical protein